LKARHCLRMTLLWLCAGLPAYSQWKEPPATGSPSEHLPDRTTFAGQAGLGPLLIIKLVDLKTNARNHKAVVEVQTDGLRMVDPIPINHGPLLDEAYLRYRLDDGTIQNTTSKTWTFAHLSSGNHLIRVALATTDGRQLGEEQSLRVKVP
jgi:hypothetical protein